MAERLWSLRESVKQSSLNRYELNHSSPTFETLTRYAAMDYIFGCTDNSQGKLYKYKLKIQQNAPRCRSLWKCTLTTHLLWMCGSRKHCCKCLGRRNNECCYLRPLLHLSQTEQSIEGQLHTCNEYARNNGYFVVGEYIDRAQSGTTDSCAEFQRMIADSDKHTFEGVLVYQPDRFARNCYDSAINKAKLKKNDVRVLAAWENISDNANGILVEGILESMAEYYSAKLSQKIRRGMEINAKVFGQWQQSWFGL